GHITTYRSLLSPVRRLPWDILTLVFLFLCGEPTWWDSTRVKPPAFQLSQVCASWRELAINTPTLWSNVLFDLSKDDYKWSSKSSFIRLCLQRSSQVPLDLKLRVEGAATDIDRTISDGVIWPTSHRWRSLDVYDGPFKVGIKRLWSQITDLSNLECLEVTASTLITALDASPALCQAARLRCLHLNLFHAPEISILTAPLQAFPWAQLTTLCLVCMNCPPQFNIICACMHLTKLELLMDREYAYGDLPSHNGTDLVTLKHLNDLRFEMGDFNGYELRPLLIEVFSRMTTPALKHLTVSFPSPDIEWFIDHNSSNCWSLDAFAEFARRSGCTLTSLCIDSPITPSECLSLLRLFPDLTELDIREPSDDPEFEGLDFPWKIITDSLFNGLRTPYPTDRLFEDRTTTIPCIPRLRHLSLHVEVDSRSGCLIRSRNYLLAFDHANW
ncbi:hypothetical protein K435DRAFT_881172, partial [Dendrothele bispora CBS 962.96]